MPDFLCVYFNDICYLKREYAILDLYGVDHKLRHALGEKGGWLGEFLLDYDNFLEIFRQGGGAVGLKSLFYA